jgi:hypothetical protein
MSKKGKTSLPSKYVKCVGFTYSVDQSDFATVEVMGETCTDTKQIRINSHNSNLETLQDTFIHECLHALLESILPATNDIEKADDKEEYIIQLLTPRLREWITDNPEWIKWIWKKKNY